MLWRHRMVTASTLLVLKYYLEMAIYRDWYWLLLGPIR